MPLICRIRASALLRALSVFDVTMLAGALLPFPAMAANEPPEPLAAGSASVSINGQPAARQGDRGGGSVVKDGSHNVFINGKPAATVRSQSECGGSIITGSPSVFINGRPVATGGSLTKPCSR